MSEMFGEFVTQILSDFFLRNILYTTRIVYHNLQ